MEEEIMRVEIADIGDSDHGYAVIEIGLKSDGTGQSCTFPVEATKAYELLRLFNVEFLRQAVGLPIIVLRKEKYGLIQGLKSLPCDSPVEVMRQ